MSNRAMVSQPMGSKEFIEILTVRVDAKDKIEAMGFEFVDTLITDDSLGENEKKWKGFVNKPLFFLAESLKTMSTCDAVFFCEGWEDARGCIIEHEAAKRYGLDIYYVD